jgi:cytochrome c553
VIALATLGIAAMVHTSTSQAQDISKIKGDRALGEYLSSNCVTCHQASGKSTAGVPPIVGWPKDQFFVVMKSYKDKMRDNKVMQTIAASLSDEDIASLAIYFGELKPPGAPVGGK